MAVDLDPLWRELGTQGLTLAVRGLTGSSPTVNRYQGYNEIVLSDNQKLAAQAYLMQQLNREPGAIRIDVAPVLVPIVLKKYWPWAAGLAAAGAAIGFLIAKGGKRK